MATHRDQVRAARRLLYWADRERIAVRVVTFLNRHHTVVVRAWDRNAARPRRNRGASETGQITRRSLGQGGVQGCWRNSDFRTPRKSRKTRREPRIRANATHSRHEAMITFLYGVLLSGRFSRIFPCVRAPVGFWGVPLAVKDGQNPTDSPNPRDSRQENGGKFSEIPQNLRRKKPTLLRTTGTIQSVQNFSHGA